MFIKMLPETEQALLLELATLLALADNELLWDGKTKEELTSDSNLNNVSIQKNDLETELLEEMKACIPSSSSISSRGFARLSNNSSSVGGLWSSVSAAMNILNGDAETLLLDKLKAFPLAKIDAPESRLQAATSVLKTLLDGKTSSELVTPKIILFQLFLVALRDGQITNIEWMLLKEIQQYYLLPDFIFEDLLQRAEALSSEISKILALILE